MVSVWLGVWLDLPFFCHNIAKYKVLYILSLIFNHIIKKECIRCMTFGQISRKNFFFFPMRLEKVAQPYTKCLFFSNIWLRIRDNTYNTLYLPVNS